MSLILPLPLIWLWCDVGVWLKEGCRVLLLPDELVFGRRAAAAISACRYTVPVLCSVLGTDAVSVARNLGDI